ncbi:Crp/Fnr family transcriptional regulator [Asticcacaulis sp. AND118]|uniref:Crp/Fnr family transcriptional regulator n=1 Tax=Asticcacaulis sp. AND118 TaxID=2840468 RepID=UPI001CFF5C5A|nr:Crp/Fnr family transcriptional regulator [Asticcacaulis sp. AND118]UDF04896.1 Crp/Fnr family transcriptional regulator [Asticcacaulis sp. AND118]
MALRPADRMRLQEKMETIEAGRGTVLFNNGDVVRHAWFPLGATLVGFRVLLDDGRGVETALVGREGAIGGIVSQGRLPAFSCAEVQFPGKLMRIDLQALEKLKTESLTLRYFFARYADCLLAQVFQSVACNATHTIEQRAARWLTMALDRTETATIPLTQDQLSSMLGVGRAYVSRVMGVLQRDGLLATVRGRVEIRDPAGLRQRACGCGAQVRAHFDEVLAGVYPSSADNEVSAK